MLEPRAAAPIPTEPGYYWAYPRQEPPEVVEVDHSREEPAVLFPGDEVRHGADPDYESRVPSIVRYVGPLTPPSADAPYRPSRITACT